MTADRELEQARANIAAGSFDSAHSVLASLEARGETSYDLHCLYGQAHLGLAKKYTNLLIQELEGDDDRPGTVDELLRSSQEHFQKAVDSFTEALAIAPLSSESLLGRAKANRSLTNYGACAVDFELLLESYPRDSFVRGEYAQHLLYEGNIEDASREFDKAVALSTTPAAELHLKRAQCYVEMDREGDALTELEYALQLEPDNLPGLLLFHELLQNTTTDEESETLNENVLRRCVETAKQIMALCPGNASVAASLLTDLHCLNRHEEALALADAYIASGMANRYELLYSCRSDLRFEVGDYEGSLSDAHAYLQASLEQCTERQPIDPELQELHQFETDLPCVHSWDFDRLARCYAKLGRHQEAIQNYTHAVSIDTCLSYFEGRAESHLALKDYTAALKDLDHVWSHRERPMEDAALLERRGRCLEAIGRTEEAAALLSQLDSVRVHSPPSGE